VVAAEHGLVRARDSHQATLSHRLNARIKEHRGRACTKNSKRGFGSLAVERMNKRIRTVGVKVDNVELLARGAVLVHHHRRVAAVGNQNLCVREPARIQS
jgi:hypothetical protein